MTNESNEEEISLDVSNDEAITRYLTQSDHYSVLYNTVKPKAFQAPPNSLLSVFRTSGLEEDAIWDMANRHVLQPLRVIRGDSARIHGRADILAGEIVGEGLRIDADNIPLRHANITDWPKERSEILDIRGNLADKSKLVLQE